MFHLRFYFFHLIIIDFAYLHVFQLKYYIYYRFCICFHYKRVVWKKQWVYSTQDHLYTLLKGKMDPKDVMNVFIVIIYESFKNKSYPYKKHAEITDKCYFTHVLSISYVKKKHNKS